MSGERAIEHRVGADEAGKTLAAIVRAALGVPWSRAEKLITTRRVRVDGIALTEPARRMVAGEIVVMAPEAAAVTRGMLEPERVVYADKDVVVVRKPPGLLTVPFESEDRDTLIDRTRVLLKHRRFGVEPSAGGEVELGAVQRLDKETSGLVVFTRSFAAKKALSRAFAEHDVERRYLAIVHGTARSARYATWLVKDRGDGIRGSMPSREGQPPRADAQHAVTHVEVRQVLDGATLVECRLETGRTHQIRIHLAEAGTPIVGEPVYIRDYRGDRDDPKFRAPRPLLHAWVLGFARPLGGGPPLRFEEPLPSDFVEVLLRLGGRSLS